MFKVTSYRLEFEIEKDWNEGLDQYQTAALKQLLIKHGFHYIYHSREYEPDYETFSFSPDDPELMDLSPRKIIEKFNQTLIVLRDFIKKEGELSGF